MGGTVSESYRAWFSCSSSPTAASELLVWMHSDDAALRRRGRSSCRLESDDVYVACPDGVSLNSPRLDLRGAVV